MKRRITELRKTAWGIWLKSFLVTWLNSLLYFCAWIWIVLPLFPTLPFVSYWVWFGLELVRGKVLKSGYVGTVNKSIELVPEKDKWGSFLFGYAFVFLILWLCSLSVSPSSFLGIDLPKVSIQVGG